MKKTVNNIAANAYKSSIPKNAEERSIPVCANDHGTAMECVLNGKVVGYRHFDEDGLLDLEYGLKDGKKHGMEYSWLFGQLYSAGPYVNGLIHGTARQWGDDGKLIGTYTLSNGTGIDLWRDQREDGLIYLCEVWHWKKGKIHGFEWWINEDQKTVWTERHHFEGQLHGIWREWNDKGNLSRGFPQYYVQGEKVNKRQYLKACQTDPTLPPFRFEDNEPGRCFPPEVAKELNFPQ